MRAETAAIYLGIATNAAALLKSVMWLLRPWVPVAWRLLTRKR